MAQRKLTFTVTVEFTEPVESDDQTMEVAQNILDAIISHAQTAGISPEESEGYTDAVSVKPIFLDEILREELG